jgi:threonyl-tRNA synthetase
VKDEFLPFIKNVVKELQLLGIRAEADISGERLAKQIRNAEKAKIPVMAIVGEKEIESNSLNIRTRASGELGEIPVAEVTERMKQAIANFTTF